MSATLICIAGIDGSGKSTQHGLLVKALQDQGRTVVPLKFVPGATNLTLELAERLTGDRFDFTGLDLEAREYLHAADVWHYWNETRVKLPQDCVAIWDRGPVCYRAYGRAYGAQSRTVEMAWDMLPQPTLTFLLVLPVQVAWARLQNRLGRSIQSNEAPELLERVAAEYASMAKRDNSIILVRADRPEDEVHRFMFHHVQNRFN